ncbi:MAG: hypothetical protein P4L46_12880 [Fimbriimonas sp.]|nr:hypothetical protein [Fimbriimonas sp.]
MQNFTSGKEEKLDLAEYGFDEGLRGVHTSRTMMLSELEAVMGSIDLVVSPTDVRHAILEDNVLGKATRSGRKNSATKLIILYSFNPKQQLFYAFELLWRNTTTSRPVLAILLALSRDTVLRASVDTVTDTPIGSTLTKEQLYKSLLSGFASKYAETTLQSTSQNIASTWRQSGHIKGEKPIVRAKAPADFHILAFALLIGYLRGLRGQNLLSSDWVRLLDFDAAELEAVTPIAYESFLF